MQRNLKLSSGRTYEESQGIDGFVGEEAYSIKPNTYKRLLINRLYERSGSPHRIVDRPQHKFPFEVFEKLRYYIYKVNLTAEGFF